MKIIYNPCKNLLIKKYPFVADQTAMLERMKEHQINFTLQLQTLNVYIFTEWVDATDKYYLDVSVCWCNETIDNASHSTFDYDLQSFEDACHWIDTQRIDFAKQLL